MPLSAQFIAAVRNVLLEVYPVFSSLALNDFRRVLRPTAPGTHAISLEPYRGSSTYIAFYRAIEASESVTQLRAAIAGFQPEFSYQLVLPGRTMHIGDCNALITAWCIALEQDPNAPLSLPQAVGTLLTDLDRLIDEKCLTHRAVASLAGLKLEGIEAPIVIDKGVTLRALSESELIELGAHDITFGQTHDVISHSVYCCIEFESQCSFSLVPDRPQNAVVSEVTQTVIDRTANVVRALHLVKSGRTGVFLTQTEFTPKLLPYLGSGSSWPLNRSTFASLELLRSEVNSFLEIERALLEASRQEFRVAADRLVDAENRLSPVDSLLDAVIGLEVVLNPMDSSELAFRVALNYAFLAPAELRRERYDRVRLLQKTRNRVVHGGLNLQSADAATIYEHAELAKTCLRDTLKSFLLDVNLKGNHKLDAAFWLDRVIPVATGQEMLALSGHEYGLTPH